MCWSVKQTKITVLLLLFCSVLCTHAQVSSLSKSDSGFISYRLEGEPAHRLFLHKDTLRVEVKGIGLFPHYTLSYVIAQDGCLQRVGTPNARQTVKKGIDMDLSISASLDGKCLRHISDNEIRISGNNRPYFREQAVKNVLHGMDLLWIYKTGDIAPQFTEEEKGEAVRGNGNSSPYNNNGYRVRYGKHSYRCRRHTCFRGWQCLTRLAGLETGTGIKRQERYATAF